MHGCREIGEHDSFLVSHRVSRIPLLEGKETVAGTTAIPRLCTSQHHWPGPQRESDCAEAAGLGADLVFTDKLSGSSWTDLPGLSAMLRRATPLFLRNHRFAAYGRRTDRTIAGPGRSPSLPSSRSTPTVRPAGSSARRKAAAAVRAEAQEIAADENDRAEEKQVVHDMETLRAG